MMAAPAPSLDDFERHVRGYLDRGWALVFMPYGSKGPRTENWNAPSELITTVDRALSRLAAGPVNVGLVHSASGTMALDVDDEVLARSIFGEFDLDYDAIMGAGLRVVSPTPNRAKVIFAAPSDAPGRKQLSWPKRDGTNGKMAIVDLRGGANQDVLVPSQHPSGGLYTWAPGQGFFDLRETPAIPPDLLRFWRALDSDHGFQQQLQAMCPWVQASAPMQQRRRNVGGEAADTIGKFNAQHTIEEMLQRGGYERRGKKWMHPSSTSKMPGVTVKDGKMFSHHGSDPLCDGYWHDSFDLFVQENYGDFQRALEDAGREVGFHVEHPPIDEDTRASVAAINAKVLSRPAAAAIAPPEAVLVAPLVPLTLPEEMVRVGGFVGALTDWILATAPRQHSILAHVAALSLAGVMLGRKVCSKSDLRTNQMLISVARTGAGKDHPRKAIARLARNVHPDKHGGLEGKFFGPSEFASGAGLLSLMHDKPNVLCQLDEMGLMLQKWLNTRAAAHDADVQRQILNISTSANGNLTGVARADTKTFAAKLTPYPCLHIHGTTTPDTFFDALSGSQVANGFLNRFLVYFTPERALTQVRSVEFTDPPIELIEWCRAANDMFGPGGFVGRSADVPIKLLADPDAERLSDAFDAECLAHQNRGEEIWQRAGEHVQRLAMIYACSRYRGDELMARAAEGRLWIDAGSMQMAISEVRLVVTAMAVKTGQHVSDSDFDRLCLAIYHSIEKAGEAGASKADLYRNCRRFKAAESRLSHSAIGFLQEVGRIREVRSESGKVGRPRVAYVACAREEGA